MRLLPALIALAVLATPSFGQYKMQTPAGEAPGPWIFGTIGVGKGPDGKPITTALKGLAIKLGEKGEAGIAYDLDRCRVAGVWTGGKFVTPMNLMSRGEYPTAMGTVAFTTGDVPGFGVEAIDSTQGEGIEKAAATGSGDRSPSVERILSPAKARFLGLRRSGPADVILDWEIEGAKVSERPSYETRDGVSYFCRTFWVAPSTKRLSIALHRDDELVLTRSSRASGSQSAYQFWRHRDLLPVGLEKADGDRRGVVVLGPNEWFLRGIPRSADTASSGPLPSLELRLTDGHWRLVAEPGRRAVFQVLTWAGGDNASELAFLQIAKETPPAVNAVPAPVEKPGSGTPAVVETSGALSPDTASAYVVDTVKLPDPNPWNAPMFIGGFDFFADGRAAVCTFHGDVFLVSGLEGDLAKVRWQRMASGLYHALGLKIVNDQVYVTCRDGIYRLKDFNGDGEADGYEAFNYDLKVTPNFHEFVFDLQADPRGNFYFAKAGPVKNGGRGFEEIMAQHGTLMRVSPDGAKLDVVATGLRAPNGIGVGPNGELTSGDNEGTWTPACRLNWIKPGGFYGVVDLAHRTPAPTDYDRPLCWLPRHVDNSSGSQVWVPDTDRWGPWRGQLLHLSYGHAALFGVLREEVEIPVAKEPVVQGGVTKFPLKFESGIMRARFHPKDGQLWVGGLRGWQTDGIKNGCLQRVRYTGAQVRTPTEMHAKKNGVELRFGCSLDTAAAADPENWSVEVWNYLWSSAYGSPEVSTMTDLAKPAEGGQDGVAQFSKTQMSQSQRDSLKVKSVSIGTDDRSVFLEIEGMKPVMQMSIRYGIKASDGTEMKGEVVNTVHAVAD